MLIGLLGMVQSLYAAPVKIALKETADLKSVQAVLFQSLKSYEENFRGRSGMPVTVEENGERGKVILQDETNRIECNLRPEPIPFNDEKDKLPGFLYRCEFDLSDLRLEWTLNANSVPAVLNEALRLHKSEVADSPVVVRGRKTFVRDGGNSVNAQSSSGEWTPAERYNAWFSFEDLCSISLDKNGDISEIIVTYEGDTIGSPLREGARTIELELLNYPIDRIEVRWRAKRGQNTQGWLFIDQKEYDWGREVSDMWDVETWDHVLSGFTFQVGIARDDDGSTNTQVDIDWIKVYYTPPKN